MVCGRRILDLIAIVAGIMLISAEPAFAQGLKKGTNPAETSISTSAAFCSDLSGGFRVCRVRLSEDDDAEFQVQRSGVTLAKIDADFWSNIAVEPKDFFAYRGDMDRDGASEIVLVSLNGVSQGMGVTYATAYIFDGRTLEKGKPPISVPIEEFGDRENFIYDRKTGRTNVLITYWRNYDSIEPKRQPGVYLIGKWVSYRNGRLQPMLTRPTLARRFLNSFAAERDNGWFENRTPFTWLKDRRTFQLAREPKTNAKLLKTEFGKITSYREPDGEGSEFAIRLDGGEAILTRLAPFVSGESNLRTESIGIWSRQILYPNPRSGGLRLFAFAEKIEGRRVRVETYKPEYGDEFMRIWFLD